MRGMAVDIKVNDFNPRPPRGGRQNNKQVGPHFQVFQSTPSARRATTAGGGLESVEGISMHALREVGDHARRWSVKGAGYFNPRPPRGGRPNCRRWWSAWQGISIHALREEGDQPRFCSILTKFNFNPRPPRGGRHQTEGKRR